MEPLYQELELAAGKLKFQAELIFTVFG